ncbi:MAG TPA: type II secretion system F family protein [Gemmatimonadales bacterium]|nr:type II secretion system F family protein [Gemmatimonadales bacterium]
MTSFRYRAARPDGRIVSGSVNAESAGSAAALLLARGLSPVEGLRESPGTRVRPASRRQLAVVFRSLVSLVNAGLPVERAFAASVPLARGRLRQLLADVHRAIHEGSSVAAALKAGMGLVPSVIVGMIGAGERAGQLGTALDRAASHLEQEAELLGRLRQSLAYPAMLAVTGTVSVLVIGAVVVPRFAVLLADLGQVLPLSTRLLLAGSSILTRHGFVLALFAAALAALTYRAFQAPSLSTWLHEAVLGMPVVGSVRHSLASGRFCRAFASSLRSGMPALPALGAGMEAVGDTAIASRLGRARERVSRGQPIADSLSTESAVVPVCAQLLAVGEAGGRLAELAERAADVAAGEGERALRMLVAVIEPLFIIVFGGIVIFVAMALLQAVYGLRPA